MKLPMLDKTCIICGKSFQTKRELTIACSVPCGDNLRQRRRRERHLRSKQRPPGFIEEASIINQTAWDNLRGKG